MTFIAIALITVLCIAWRVDRLWWQHRREVAAHDRAICETTLQATSRYWRRRYEGLRERKTREIALMLVESKTLRYEDIIPILRRQIE